MPENPNEITVFIGARGAGVPISSLVTVLNHFKGILRSTAEQLASGKSNRIQWEIVAATMNSPLALTMAGRSESERFPKRVIRTALENVRRIEKKAELPDTMTDQDLESANAMVSVLNDGVDSLVISAPGIDKVILTLHISANVREIRSHYTHRQASFRGRLYDITTHGGKHNFEIFDTITNESIVCNFQQDQYEKVGLLLRKRVIVYGKARYSPKGDLLSIDVTDFDAIPDSPIRISEFEKIDVPSGFDSVDFIRKVRDGKCL